MVREKMTTTNKLAVCVMALIMTAVCILCPLPVSAKEGEAFHYVHNPMDNPKAAADIVVNEDAVYGFSPSPDSVRLKEFADAIDWTDEAQVAQAREERAKYHAKNAELYEMITTLQNEGKTVEETARAVSRRRNEIRLEAYKDDPDGLAIVKQSNLDTYGNEEGPTADSLYEKYGSWQTVLEKALSSNAGMDACLGFYDEYYFTYDIAPSVNTAPGVPYIVKSGDSLWKISVQFYNTGRRWTEIFEKNKNVIQNPSYIFPGQVINLP